LASVETSDSGRTAGIASAVRDAPRGETKVDLQSSCAFAARNHVRKKSRRGVAAGGGPLSRRTAIVLELEQGKLPVLGSFPCLKLLATEFSNLLPTIAVIANRYDVGLRHGGRLSGGRLVGCGFLQAVQKARRPLRMRCSGENCTLAIFEQLDPRF